MLRRLLLVCGILSSALYTIMNVVVPLWSPGYSPTAQTVSELSAIGAPTRTIWVWLGSLYGLLAAAFGLGVWKSSGQNRPLRMVGVLLIGHGVLSLYWPPMHARGAEFTLTDQLHIVWTMLTVLLMMLALGFGAAAFGQRFRIYSIATMLILAVFGGLTGMEAPQIASNMPTPMVGVWERIGIAAFVFWLGVLAIAVLLSQTEMNRSMNAVSDKTVPKRKAARFKPA